jgi:hypothetical protein
MNAPFNFPVISVSPDGKWLAALEHPRGTEANREKTLKVISTENGKARELGRQISYISPLSDGRRIAFSSFGPTVHGPEVWVIENFLPGDNAQGKNKR